MKIFSKSNDKRNADIIGTSKDMKKISEKGDTKKVIDCFGKLNKKKLI